MKMPESRFGTACLVGKPNVGKSTLLNQLVGQKVSIVSHKAQTTRQNITGILVSGESQIAFVDTPGISFSRRTHDRRLVATAWNGVAGADIVLLMVSAAKSPTPESSALIETFSGFTTEHRRRALVINKIDLVRRSLLLPLTRRLTASVEFDAVFMVSARTGDGVDDLTAWLASNVPAGRWQYDKDQVADMSVQFAACEITREKLFLRLHQEVPYQLTVETDQWEEKADGSVRISQFISVPRKSQQKVVVGTGGAVLLEVGKRSRQEISAMLGRPAHLFLRVRVREGTAPPVCAGSMARSGDGGPVQNIGTSKRQHGGLAQRR